MAGVFLILAGVMIQLDIPAFQGVWRILANSFVERQLEIQESREDRLKQGWVLYHLGEYARARDIMERIAHEEENISAIYCLGLINLKFRQYGEGVARLETVAQKSPEHVPTRIILGKTYYQLRYYGKARARLEEAVKLDETNGEARLWLGKTYLRLNKRDQALGVLKTVRDGGVALEAAALVRKLQAE